MGRGSTPVTARPSRRPRPRWQPRKVPCYHPPPQLDPWCSGPTCQPVTLEIAGSNPVGSAITPLPTPRPPPGRGVSLAVRGKPPPGAIGPACSRRPRAPPLTVALAFAQRDAIDEMEASRMLSEFRAFLLKTNALALAIGVIIGVALGSVVNSLVND